MIRLILAMTALMAAQSAGPVLEDQLARHRNLGKAFFENPTTQAQAVTEFGKALAVAPQSARERLNYGIALLAAGKTAEGIAEIQKVQAQQSALPHTWFNLGVQFKKAGEYDKAKEQFDGFASRVPSEPTGHYNLGVLLKLANRNPEAIAAFETASKLNPNLAAPHFQLYNLYRQSSRRDEAAVQLKLFQSAKDAAAGSPTSEDMEWNWYSEILDEVDLKNAAVASGAPREWKFLPRRLSPPVPGPLTRPVVFDAQGDGRPDLAVAVGGNLRLYTGSAGAAALPTTIGRDVYFAAPGDFNNDGLADLSVLTTRGPMLLVNNKGTFAEKPLPAAPAGRYDVAVWLDYDHDNDLDLLLLGKGANALLRNEGAAFADRTADFPFVQGQPSGAIGFRLVPDTKAFDLVVSYHDRPAVLYRDKLAGRFEAREFAALPAGTTVLAALDADNSGTLDLLFEAPGGKGGVLFNASAPNQDSKLEWIPASLPSPLIAADWENRGVQDFLAAGSAVRYAGVRQYQPGQAVAGLPPSTFYAAADFNGDGKVDLAAVAPDGAVHLLSNATVSPNQSVRVTLAGIKNPKLAAGSEVEVRIAGRYQKKIYAGQPLLFGVGDARMMDAVRITWPNGLIQSEANQAVKAQSYPEAQRLSGSCPQVWTWNGHEFVYVTDVLGVAPLGAMSGDGSYFPVDHLEHIQIPAGAMVARHGRYEIRLTEELSEIAYVDQVKLLAVDHPAGQTVFLNEKFQAPPYPDLKLYGVARRLKPESTTVKPGESLVMKFGSAASRLLQKPILVLTGWVEWADGSQFRAASQRPGGELRMPSLEVLENGRWRTVIADMGLPAGKPKSIVVELQPEWLRGDALRISSNLAVFWTDAFLSEASPGQPFVSAAMQPQRADLRFRGFSRVHLDPARQAPEKFAYSDPLPSSMWNPTPGLYTRFGEVRALMQDADDRFVIMGSGDELALEFDAAAFPPVPAGHVRSFVLAVDGWAKDRDPNTAHSATVEPLPFHGMSQYPYPDAERFPDTPAHRAWRKEYNTRPALRLLRPLSSNLKGLP